MLAGTDDATPGALGISFEKANERFRLDPAEARAVASAFSDALDCRRDHQVVAAYDALREQSDRLFLALTDPGRRGAIQIVFTHATNPYTSDRELISAVRSERLLEVSVASRSGRLHPLFACDPGGPYDRFRAVHDILGHVRAGLGFDRQGEYAAWRIQDLQYTGLARLALASELHAEHSAYWTTGALPEHKAWLLEARLLGWARTGTDIDSPCSTGSSHMTNSSA